MRKRREAGEAAKGAADKELGALRANLAEAEKARTDLAARMTGLQKDFDLAEEEQKQILAQRSSSSQRPENRPTRRWPSCKAQLAEAGKKAEAGAVRTEELEKQLAEATGALETAKGPRKRIWAPCAPVWPARRRRARRSKRAALGEELALAKEQQKTVSAEAGKRIEAATKASSEKVALLGPRWPRRGKRRRPAPRAAALGLAGPGALAAAKGASEKELGALKASRPPPKRRGPIWRRR
ncbi:MAG: hypothetical protein U1G05_06415 [Kiritimatiellia bacterium]